MESRSFTSHASSAEASVEEISSQIGGTPSGIIFFCDYSWLAVVSQKLHDMYPDTQIIGTAGTYYHASDIEDSRSLTVTAIMSGAEVAAGVIRYLSTAPLADTAHLMDALDRVHPGRDNTVMFEFCTNDEEVLVSSVSMELEGTGVSLVGGTVFGSPEGQPSRVSVNGTVYEDACSFIMIKNTSGRVFTYRETIYGIDSGIGHVATKVRLKDKAVLELDNRPAAEVYSEETGVPQKGIIDNVQNAPLGRRIGEDDIYIASMKELRDGGFTMYKRVNLNDRMYILKLLDYRQINQETFERVRSEISRPSLILSVNCIYRYLLFAQNGYMRELLHGIDGLTQNSVGYVAGGEQFGRQHMNQTMVMAVFE